MGISMDFAHLSDYLAALAENNDRAWFQAHREEYDALRADFHDFVGRVIGRIAAFDDSVTWKDPRDCIFRIYRDVRFSNDKTPYKTTFSAHISDQRRRGGPPGCYLEVDQAGSLFGAAGIWMPPPPVALRIRTAIAERPERLQKVLRARAMTSVFDGLQGDALTRPPRGFGADTPLLEHVKRKSWIVWRETEARPLSDDAALDWLAESFRAAHPLVGWLRAILGEGGGENA